MINYMNMFISKLIQEKYRTKIPDDPSTILLSYFQYLIHASYGNLSIFF